mmetsp:Transcript_2243/g.6058  ORF Transcript_2243/g.6058 Transcript_2243/m.6058 type:complete len:260 (-) Transcript_2243:1533-2312(-)
MCDTCLSGLTMTNAPALPHAGCRLSRSFLTTSPSRSQHTQKSLGCTSSWLIPPRRSLMCLPIELRLPPPMEEGMMAALPAVRMTATLQPPHGHPDAIPIRPTDSHATCNRSSNVSDMVSWVTSWFLLAVHSSVRNANQLLDGAEGPSLPSDTRSTSSRVWCGPHSSLCSLVNCVRGPLLPSGISPSDVSGHLSPGLTAPGMCPLPIILWSVGYLSVVCDMAPLMWRFTGPLPSTNGSTLRSAHVTHPFASMRSLYPMEV